MLHDPPPESACLCRVRSCFHSLALALPLRHLLSHPAPSLSRSRSRFHSPSPAPSLSVVIRNGVMPVQLRENRHNTTPYTCARSEGEQDLSLSLSLSSLSLSHTHTHISRARARALSLFSPSLSPSLSWCVCGKSSCVCARIPSF